jgi:hypothetical protein
MPLTPSSVAESSETKSTAIAPAWHTGGVLLLLLGMGALSLHSRSVAHGAHAPHRVLSYAIIIASEWLIVAFIAWGAGWGGASLRSLAGRFAPTWRTVLRDLGIAIAYLVAAEIVLGVLTVLLGHFMHSDANQVLKNMVPHTGLETAVYLLVALTAGICEETIFRGYLQHQFTAWTGNAAAGIALQGILFGIAHAYQGVVMIIVITVYGCMFGMLAWWRQSLRPAMAAHFLQDAIGGILLAKLAPK